MSDTLPLSIASPSLRLLVGLGNPGTRYRHTRHNLGFMVLDRLAQRHQLSWRSKPQASYSSWQQCYLLKPMTFMNLSGQAVQAASRKRGITATHILVVHDDLDLPLGRLRLRSGGSAGGQRGVQDIIKRVGKDVHRLKLGIGRPPPGWQVERWVLSRFREDEATLLTHILETACDALETALHHGMSQAMNQYNGTDLR